MRSCFSVLGSAHTRYLRHACAFMSRRRSDRPPGLSSVSLTQFFTLDRDWLSTVTSLVPPSASVPPAIQIVFDQLGNRVDPGCIAKSGHFLLAPPARSSSASRLSTPVENWTVGAGRKLDTSRSPLRLQHLLALALEPVAVAPEDDDLGVVTSRSTIAATATGSPKISAHAEKVLLEFTMSERRS